MEILRSLGNNNFSRLVGGNQIYQLAAGSSLIKGFEFKKVLAEKNNAMATLYKK